jgi:hypothetical protein
VVVLLQGSSRVRQGSAGFFQGSAAFARLLLKRRPSDDEDAVGPPWTGGESLVDPLGRTSPPKGSSLSSLGSPAFKGLAEGLGFDFFDSTSPISKLGLTVYK